MTMVADESASWLASRRWIFTLTVAFLYAACVLRSVLGFDGARRQVALALLAVWLVLLLTEPALTRRWRPYFTVYIGLQSVIVALLLSLSHVSAHSSDFFAILLGVASMQAMERWTVRGVSVLIGLFAVLTALGLRNEYGLLQAIAFAAIYTGVNVFLASYALAARRATQAQAHNEELAGELRETNGRLVEYAARVERLAVVRERQRLARDLHDSVTQTLFSMTLTARSASLLLEREPQRVAAQLDQLDQLAHGAQAEMATLSAELPPAPAVDGGLPAALAEHLRERERRDGLTVSLDVDGDEVLPPDDVAVVQRLVQEALNNVVKHARTSSATVRVRLRRPFRIEVEDAGAGFDVNRPTASGLGLAGMKERAAEIGWELTVTSAPGVGTCVTAEEATTEGGRDGVPG